MKWYILIALLQLASCLEERKCPKICHCNFDDDDRYRTVCSSGDMKKLPINSLDKEIEVLIVNGPKNHITIGPIFIQFKNLTELRITDSLVPAIGQNSFWGVKSLRILDLSHNNITIIKDDNFRGQDGLQELDLSFNNIERMPSAVFYHLKDLRILNLGDNSIEELPQRVFLMLGKLEYLDLSNNPLQNLIPDVFKDIMELKYFKCRHCQLMKMNPQIYNLVRHLNHLDLGDNQFKYLERDEYYDLRNLTKLQLDGNQLSVIVDHLFEQQKNLKFLDVSRNRLAKVTDNAFMNLSNLTYLDLSYNKLDRLEANCLRHLKSLLHLNISGNVQMDLHEIRESIQQTVSNIRTLSIADMGPLPVDLQLSYANLETLNLSGNHLENNSFHLIQPLNRLQLLDLSRNQFNGFNEEFSTKLKIIKNVKMENNPLICDRCHMGSLIENAAELPWQSFPECFQPETLRGVEIVFLHPVKLESCFEFIADEGYDAASTSYNFLEQANLNILTILMAIAILVLIGFALIIAIHCRRQQAQYYTHEDKRLDAGALDKNLEPTSLTVAIAPNEINFKFPIDDRVCTIDEIVLPSPPPPPGTANHRNGNGMKIERIEMNC